MIRNLPFLGLLKGRLPASVYGMICRVPFDPTWVLRNPDHIEIRWHVFCGFEPLWYFPEHPHVSAVCSYLMAHPEDLHRVDMLRKGTILRELTCDVGRVSGQRTGIPGPWEFVHFGSLVALCWPESHRRAIDTHWERINRRLALREDPLSTERHPIYTAYVARFQMELPLYTRPVGSPQDSFEATYKLDPTQMRKSRKVGVNLKGWGPPTPMAKSFNDIHTRLLMYAGDSAFVGYGPFERQLNERPTRPT